MLKALLLATFASLALGAQAAQPDSFAKEAADATWHAPLLAGAPGDLDPDPGFGTLVPGTQFYYLDTMNSREGHALRTFKRPGNAGWYVLAKHGTGLGVWDAVVVVTGPNGAEERTIYVRTPMFRLDDATWDSANGRFYFVGGAKQTGHADSDFGVTCVDIDAEATCSGFGTDGTAYIAFNRGGNNDDVARRVISRPNLGVMVAGWAKDDTNRYVFAATALYRASGAPVPRFGNNGLFASDLGSILANLDVNVYAMAVSNDPDQDARLYIAGNYSRNVARNYYDGVVLGLNAWNGVLDTWGPGGNGSTQVAIHSGEANGWTQDAVTALTVLGDGRLALAGWTIDNQGWRQMLVARLRQGGLIDTNSDFCRPAGLCIPVINLGQEIWPVAIAQRPGNGDLIVAAENARQPGVNDETASRIVQLASSGQFRDDRILGLGAYEGQRYQMPVGLLVDRGDTMVLGTKRYDPAYNDFDVTLTRLLANDTIFADNFDAAGGN